MKRSKIFVWILLLFVYEVVGKLDINIPDPHWAGSAVLFADVPASQKFATSEDFS